jgi:hypothetical protein
LAFVLTIIFIVLFNMLLMLLFTLFLLFLFTINNLKYMYLYLLVPTLAILQNPFRMF